MRLNVKSELIYDFGEGSDAILSIQAAHSAEQSVVRENLMISSSPPFVQDLADERGERRIRAHLSGEVTIRYEALVDNGQRIMLPPNIRKHGWLELPQSVLQYLSPSRYCPSDRFFLFANREFSQIQQGGEQVLAVLDWIHSHIDYVPGVSNGETTAERTFVDRAGVCRDFSHLGIALCRALNIPARAVSAYAWQLNPPDFHAVFEVFLDGGWWIVDPTRLSPIEGLVRIGVGRDATDIAFLTTTGQCTAISQCVTVREEGAADPNSVVS